MPPDYPTYPSRAQMVSYLESYAARFQVKPIKDGAIKVRGGVDRFTADGVVFADARTSPSRFTKGSHSLQSGLQPLRVLCIVALLLVALRMRNMPTCLYASALASREAGWANALL